MQINLIGPVGETHVENQVLRGIRMSNGKEHWSSRAKSNSTDVPSYGTFNLDDPASRVRFEDWLRARAASAGVTLPSEPYVMISRDVMIIVRKTVVAGE